MEAKRNEIDGPCWIEFEFCLSLVSAAMQWPLCSLVSLCSCQTHAPSAVVFMCPPLLLPGEKLLEKGLTGSPTLNRCAEGGRWGQDAVHHQKD